MTHSYQPSKGRVACGTACFIPLSSFRNPPFLLIERKGAHGAGKISVPGGWVDKGEGPEQAIIRECWEEVGINVQEVTFRGYTHDLHPEGVEDICLWFTATAWHGAVRNTNPDRIKELMWKTWGDILEMSADKKFLPLTNAISKGILPLG